MSSNSSSSNLNAKENSKAFRTNTKVLEINQDHFKAGSVIQLGSGERKKVEDLVTADFIESAALAPDLAVEQSRLMRIEQEQEEDTVLLTFRQTASIGQINIREGNTELKLYITAHLKPSQ